MVSLGVGELGEELTLRDQIGELTELVEDHIEVSDGVAEVFSLTEPLGDASEDGAGIVDNGFSGSSSVARSIGSELKLINMFGHHDKVSLLFGGGAEHFGGPLGSDVFQDSESLSELVVTIEKVWQVGVIKADSEFLVSPVGMVPSTFRGSDNLVKFFGEFDLGEGEHISDLLAITSNLPVSKGGLCCVNHFK